MPYRQEVLQDAAAATGNGREIDVSDKEYVGVHVTGTFVGTVVFEARITEDTWFSIEGIDYSDDTSGVTSATAPGAWRFVVAGTSGFRARVSAYTSGAITVVAFAE